MITAPDIERVLQEREFYKVGYRENESLEAKRRMAILTLRYKCKNGWIIDRCVKRKGG